MAATVAAVIALAVFWLVILGLRLILRDSVIDPLPALLASLCVAAFVYRAVLRHRA